MKLIFDKGKLKEFETHIRIAQNIAKRGQIKAIRVRVVSNPVSKAIITATDSYVFYNAEVPVKSSEVQGLFYLDLDKNKEAIKKQRLENKIKKLKGEKIVQQKKDYFDLEPFIVPAIDFPNTKELKKPSNYFATDKNKLLEGLDLMAINKNKATDLKILNKKAILTNKNQEFKHKYNLPVFQQNKNYGRIFFNPFLLKEIIKNLSQTTISVFYNNSFVKIGSCYLASIRKPS